jgi:hypothetical protein
MGKFSHRSISSAACRVLQNLVEDGTFCATNHRIEEIEEAEFAILLKRGLALGKKRIVIDVDYTKPGVEDDWRRADILGVI